MLVEIEFLRGWSVREASFTPAQMQGISGLPQQLLRVWRSRGYLPEKDRGQWSKHSASELATAYLLNAFSKLGVPPSESLGEVVRTSRDLLFFALSSGDGACDFTGPRGAVDTLKERFDNDMQIARVVTAPLNECRFLLSDGEGRTSRHADLSHLIEAERIEFCSYIDLLVAGRRIVERAGKPLYSFIYADGDTESANVRRLSQPR